METTFQGNVFIFHCFDVGDDIHLKRIRDKHRIALRQVPASRFFKNYHTPLAVELPKGHISPNLHHAKIHNFGVISLAYRIPFNYTLEQLRAQLNDLDATIRQQSLADAKVLFKAIEPDIKQSKFFHLRNAYVVIQVDPDPQNVDVHALRDTYGNLIASTLRFETESLSEYQRSEIIDSAIGYYRGDLIIIDTEAAFMYDDEYTELLDLFEFCNIQQMELQYFDRVLDQQLNAVYEREIQQLPLKAYIPFMAPLKHDPIDDLAKLKVDISVITERLENSIRIIGEAYYSELYSILNQELDIANWKDSIRRKLEIISEIRHVYENKITSVRGQLLEVLIIVLIFIELLVGILHYLK